MLKYYFTAPQRAKIRLAVYQLIAVQGCLLMLKLFPYAIGNAWSWWWILLPTIIPLLVLAIWFFLYMITIFMMSLVDREDNPYDN